MKSFVCTNYFVFRNTYLPFEKGPFDIFKRRARQPSSRHVLTVRAADQPSFGRIREGAGFPFGRMQTDLNTPWESLPLSPKEAHRMPCARPVNIWLSLGHEGALRRRAAVSWGGHADICRLHAGHDPPTGLGPLRPGDWALPQLAASATDSRTLIINLKLGGYLAYTPRDTLLLALVGGGVDGPVFCVVNKIFAAVQHAVPALCACRANIPLGWGRSHSFRTGK